MVLTTSHPLKTLNSDTCNYVKVLISNRTGIMVLNGESPAARVKVTLQLGSETYSALASSKGLISEQLVSVKDQSMTILKDFIMKHNIPNDVPDESDEIYDDEELSPKPPVKKSKNGQ